MRTIAVDILISFPPQGHITVRKVYLSSVQFNPSYSPIHGSHISQFTPGRIHLALWQVVKQKQMETVNDMLIQALSSFYVSIALIPLSLPWLFLSFRLFISPSVVSPLFLFICPACSLLSLPSLLALLHLIVPVSSCPSCSCAFYSLYFTYHLFKCLMNVDRHSNNGSKKGPLMVSFPNSY